MSKSALVLLVATVLVFGCSSAKDDEPTAFSTSGVVRVSGGPLDSLFDDVGDDCLPSPLDVGQGSSVVVTDAVGAIVAKGVLGAPTLAYDKIGLSMCELPFDVTEIPDGGFFNLQVGNRAPTAKAREEMTAPMVIGPGPMRAS